MGLNEVEIMIPCVRMDRRRRCTRPWEGRLEARQGVLKGDMMAEPPGNVMLADVCFEFNGFPIGSNDLAQLAFGLGRYPGLVAQFLGERGPAMLKSLEHDDFGVLRE